MKTKQAKITAKRTIEWIESELSPNPEGVVLKAIVSGVSAGTETMWYNATASALKSGRRSYPYFPGYEFVGEVVSIGSDVQSNPQDFPRLSTLNVGDKVFAFKPHCSFNVITEKDLWAAIPKGIEPEHALGLALACTSLHAIHRSEIRIGDECAVIGMGVLGLTMISCLYAAGAGSITAISRSEVKRDRAKGFGATDGLSTLDLLKPDFKTPIQLSDVVFECTGKNPGLSVALSAADKQGKIIAAGFYTEPMALDGEAIFAKELTVYGVRASGPAGARGEFLRWPRGENLRLAVEYLKRGYIRTQEMITHRVKPEQLGDIYDMVENDSDPYILAVLEW